MRNGRPGNYGQRLVDSLDTSESLHLAEDSAVLDVSTPEKRLWFQVLLQAVMDARPGTVAMLKTGTQGAQGKTVLLHCEPHKIKAWFEDYAPSICDHISHEGKGKEAHRLFKKALHYALDGKLPMKWFRRNHKKDW